MVCIPLYIIVNSVVDVFLTGHHNLCHSYFLWHVNNRLDIPALCEDVYIAIESPAGLFV